VASRSNFGLSSGIQAAQAGFYIAEALGITYASCQATKLLRIMGTLLLIPAVAEALNAVLGREDEESSIGDRKDTSSRKRVEARSVLIAVICSSIAAVLITIAALAAASMLPQP
jgi:hypothetical protein